MSNVEHSSGQDGPPSNSNALSSRRRLVNGALYESHLPATRLYNMAVAVAGQLMTNRAMVTAERTGARRFLEVIFQNLERVDNARNSQAEPARSVYGKPYESGPGIVDTGVVLLDANQRIKDFEASDEPLSPEAMGRHWVKNKLADLHEYLSQPQTEGVTVPAVKPDEMPAIERRQI